MDSGFLPNLSAGAQALLRCVYGCLLVATLAYASLYWRRFFVSGRYGGYFDPAEGFWEKLHSPLGARIVLAAWFLSAACLIFDALTVPAAVLNFILCHHYFVSSRWKSIARGFGAPGFMSYWLSLWLLILELTARYASSAHSLAVLAAQLDFSLIMLSAGFYKMLSGYARNHGMEYGMANPQWGYFPTFFKHCAPSSSLFKFLNHSAWSTEVVAGILMLIPGTRLLGGFLIFASFLFIATQIRLGILCEVVMTCCFLFVPANCQLDKMICSLMPHTVAPTASNEMLVMLANTCLLAYMVITPLIHCCLFYNLFGRKRLPGMCQAFVDKYANVFGIIIWRVFSADLTNFYINIYSLEGGDGAKKHLISKYSYLDGLRFSFVCEAIAITSLFTLRKYYPSDKKLFEERLLRYAATLPSSGSQRFEFEHVSVRKEISSFRHVPICSYLVNVREGQVTEHILDGSLSVTSKHEHSPLYAGPRAGSYAPLQVN